MATTRPTFLIVLAACAALAVPAAAQIKQWTDEHGVTHFGNEPAKRPEPTPRQILVRRAQPFELPAGLGASDTRRLADNYLKALNASLEQARMELALFDTQMQMLATGQSRSRQLDVQYYSSVKRPELQTKLLSPIYADFMSFESTIKARHNGVLPDWIKDNRAWRALDKEFSR